MVKITSIIVSTVFALGQVFGFSPYTNLTQYDTSTLRPLSDALSATPISIGATRESYFFTQGYADGEEAMREELGGKGAELCGMAKEDIPVPPGVIIPTRYCEYYRKHAGELPQELIDSVMRDLRKVEEVMGRKYGDKENPLLVSGRSGARQSMPGMMETVLNLGLTEDTLPGLIAQTDDPWFAYDTYRRLITMYADVVMEKGAGIEPATEEDGIRKQLEGIMQEMKAEKGVKEDTDLSAEDMRILCKLYKLRIKEVLGAEFPDDPYTQLWGAAKAVFASWMGKRAVNYRRIEDLPDEWGTAVIFQAMVFGNLGDNSATGVAFTRDPGTGDKKFYGEYLKGAQGEDVVAGIRTPQAINEHSKGETNRHLPTLEEEMPERYQELDAIQKKLERYQRNMLDIEFTIEGGKKRKDNKLWILQKRSGKRTPQAAIQIAVDQYEEGLITAKEAVMRLSPEDLDKKLMHTILNEDEEKEETAIAKGLPAGPGGAVGQAVFTADDAERWAKQGKKVVLIREETSPEDIHGMHPAEAVITARGGMTSHAALVARGWGKTCVVGTGMHIDAKKKQAVSGDAVIKEGAWVSVNGNEGLIYLGQIGLVKADPEKNEALKKFLAIADEVASLKVRTNADTPEDAQKARDFGAQGIGLDRTEHMFFEPEKLIVMRELIMADTDEERLAAIKKLMPFQIEDFMGILKAMEGLPVTMRLLDPPLHEFLPQSGKSKVTQWLLRTLSGLAPGLAKRDAQVYVAKELGISLKKLRERIAQLREFNPMLGHRGARVGVVYPAVTRMQVRAIATAAAKLELQGIHVFPEIMVPLIITDKEMINQRGLAEEEIAAVEKEYGVKLNIQIGTMIELPRAALTAHKIAKYADFFSFGTNDMTQTALGISRDDAAPFLGPYIEKGILPEDPFESIDQEGVGLLVLIGTVRGRSVKKDLKIGICGEHGGDPKSIIFFHNLGFDYVSCSPYRVPVARLAAAQAEVLNPRKKEAAAKSSSAGRIVEFPKTTNRFEQERTNRAITTAIGQAA